MVEGRWRFLYQIYKTNPVEIDLLLRDMKNGQAPDEDDAKDVVESIKMSR